MRTLATVLALLLGTTAHAAGHRDAPSLTFDAAADIADVFAFRSFTAEPRVTLIMTVHPFLEPGGGTLGTPFDPTVLYELQVDNDGDAIADLRFQIRFTTEIRTATPAGFAGAGSGINAPANSPPPVAPGVSIVPPKIASFADPGLGIRQSYTVTLVRREKKKKTITPLTNDTAIFALPANVGPRTMDYEALFGAAVYDLGDGVRVFAGTTDDPFFADLGALADTLNVRAAIAPGVLSPARDAGAVNVASDTLSGFAVNAIAIEVPVEMLTLFGTPEVPTSATATIGVWATTSRFPTEKHPPPKKLPKNPKFRQVDRMGNPFINDWLIGLPSKDAFVLAMPANDATFAAFFTDPAPARVLNAATAGALPIPAPPRADLAFLFGYAPPIAPQGNSLLGPTADLLRLNVGVDPTIDAGSRSRLGTLGGDLAGFPNGRRLTDDVTDVMLRILAGIYAPGFNVSPNDRLGDGVNVNDVPFRSSFPYLGSAPSGRDRRHIDPSEPGCTAGAGSSCGF